VKPQKKVSITPNVGTVLLLPQFTNHRIIYYTVFRIGELTYGQKTRSISMSQHEDPVVGFYELSYFGSGNTTRNDRFVFDGSVDHGKERGGGVLRMDNKVLHREANVSLWFGDAQ
jgi:hypothetical protein